MTRRTARLLRGLAPATVLLLAGTVAGCTAGATTSTPPVVASSASPAPASPTAPPPPPAAHACYRLPFRELSGLTSDRRPVPCSTRHDTQTIGVADLPATGTLATSGPYVQRACGRALARFLGGSRETRRLSRFAVVWFGPDQAAVDAGAHWFRCDLVAFSRDDNLLSLPTRVRGALRRADGLSTYGLCGTAAPGSPGFERVICGRPHAWVAIATIHIPGRRYPRRADLSSAGDTTCQDRSRARAGFALQFQYGWEWPSRRQWTNGQHYGYCWAPSS